MKQEYEIGGWVKCIAEAKKNKELSYNQFKLGEYYQIKSLEFDLVVTIEGYKLTTESNSAYDKECEWVGMEKPTEKKNFLLKPWEAGAIQKFPIGTKFICQHDKQTVHEVKEHTFHTSEDHLIKFNNCGGYVMFAREWAKKVENKEEKWEPKAGEYAIMMHDYGDAKRGMTVELLKPQGTTCWYVNFTGQTCTHAPYITYMRKALSHEIPQEKTETMYTPQIGDWVLLSATADGWGASKEDARNQTVQITRINDNHMWFKPKVGREVSTRITEIVRKVDGPGTPVNAMDEILAEAKRRFPAGTKFVPQDMHGEVYTVSSEERYYEGMTSNVILTKTNEGVGGQYLCYNGEWAKPVGTDSTTKDDMLAKAARVFPKGTKYVGLRDAQIYTSEGYVDCTMSNGKPASIWVGTDYVYRDGKWADVVTKSYSGIVMDMAELRPTSPVIYSRTTDGVERLPSEIIVKKKEKVGRRLMIS